ncbi:MAG TPA: hypothetical protein VFT29_05770, partial [Gemmatimonadaceae bacterium]|nr:hypothetical protein [Gemmatimonadaceae bacterium]
RPCRNQHDEEHYDRRASAEQIVDENGSAEVRRVPALEDKPAYRTAFAASALYLANAMEFSCGA